MRYEKSATNYNEYVMYVLHNFQGGIFDLDTIGGRSNGREVDIGKLKWGVGKLIAHAPKPPIVIPFFHTGTEAILPPNPVTKKVDHFIPKIGHRVTIRFGEKINFDDLIEEHEKLHGPLWKFKASVDEETSEDTEAWISKEVDKELYTKIVRRIETALSKLNDESRKVQV
jgi:monolysocardiolipin acyltransferase